MSNQIKRRYTNEGREGEKVEGMGKKREKGRKEREGGKEREGEGK